MLSLIETLNRFVWGVPALILILGTGIYLSCCTGFAQLRLFPRACRQFFQKMRTGGGKEGITPFQALCTALAATIGTGNIVGVAGAIALGGPGAVFWMWIAAILGMMLKFAEATLAVHFRVRERGEWVGGPMHMICRGLGEKWRFLAVAYCACGVLASFGIGNTAQINAVVTGVDQLITDLGGEVTFRKNLGIGLLLAVPIGIMLLGNAKRIAAAAQILVPVSGCAYVVMCLGVLFLRAQAIPGAFASILQGAFSPRAVTGGIIGSRFQALRTGVSRGIFTNEAGMGTASIAHGSAEVEHPVQQGLMGIMEVFLDTIVICTMTALVILCSGTTIPYGQDVGAVLTARAFASVYGSRANLFLTLALCSFAVATVLGWGLYGTRCAQFLFGTSAGRRFAAAQAAAVVLGAVMNTRTVWVLAELLNGLMAIPNLIALIAFRRKLRELTCQFLHPSLTTGT